MQVVVCLALCCAVLSCPAAASAQEPAPASEPGRNHFAVTPAASAITIDGSLSEPAWESAVVVPLTHEWFPSDNTAPPVATECLVTFDDDKLYVGFRAADPDPAQIRAYLADRDTAFLDDGVGFLIDTFNDRRRAFQFRINPLGVQMESQVNDIEATGTGEAFEDWTWDAIWDSAGRITAQGYEVEIAVPFKQLRFPRGGQTQTWGFLATRTYPRSVVHQLRSTRNERSLACLVCQFDSLEGFQRVESGYNLEITPTVTASRTDARPALEQPLESGDEDVEAGVSLRWGITPNVSLNAAANPDFSQVEADVAQLAVNERFALFFPEKRPFFLEGADFYSTLVPVVFTRSVVDPKLGLKLTGKESGNAFGVFIAQDRVNSRIVPGPEQSSFAFSDEEVDSAVLRYRRDVGATSTLGLLYAGRQGERDYENHVYGVDGSLRLTESDTLRFQALGSNSRYDDGLGALDDHALSADFVHATKNWFLGATFEDRGDGFRADSGFLPQVGTRLYAAGVRRTFWGGEDTWYSRFFVDASSTRTERQNGELIAADGNLFLTYQGPRQSTVRLRLLPNDEGFLGRRFEHFRADLLVNMRPRGDLFVELFLRGGEVIDFTNVRSATFRQVQPRVEFKLGRRFAGDLEHVRQAFEFEGDRYLTAHLTQTRLVYNLNLRTFLRLILQYQDVQRVPRLFNDPGVQPEEESLFTQFLFSYKLNPQTVLLVGYSDNSEGTIDVDLTQRDRTFFFKVGYAWLQ
jgi:hypothetical protein